MLSNPVSYTHLVQPIASIKSSADWMRAALLSRINMAGMLQIVLVICIIHDALQLSLIHISRPLGTPPPRRRGIEIVRISIASPLNYHL